MTWSTIGESKFARFKSDGTIYVENIDQPVGKLNSCSEGPAGASVIAETFVIPLIVKISGPAA